MPGTVTRFISKCRNPRAEYCNEISSTIGLSVIVLTARSGVEALVNLLDEGADDVLRKPFGLEELQQDAEHLKGENRITRKS